MPGDLIIRDFTLSDIPEMTRIYAHYVRTSTVTFDEEEPAEADMAEKFGHMKALGHPVLIAERDGRVLGFAYASIYRPRRAYRFTCEDTLYLDPGAIGQGIGSVLMERLISEARAFGFKQMVGVIEASAEHSIALHKKFGFELTGTNPALGFKFDRWLGIVHMQKAL